MAVGDSGVPRRDSLLLEAGFLAVLVAPLRLLKWRSTAWRAHDGVTFWLVRWLLFRLMFASGVVKLTSRCPTWWGLTGEGRRGIGAPPPGRGSGGIAPSFGLCLACPVGGCGALGSCCRRLSCVGHRSVPALPAPGRVPTPQSAPLTPPVPPALTYHYETQCIPTPAAWFAHQLPVWFQKFSVVATYVIEIAIPILFFVPIRRLRLFAFYSQVGGQSQAPRSCPPARWVPWGSPGTVCGWGDRLSPWAGQGSPEHRGGRAAGGGVPDILCPPAL